MSQHLSRRPGGATTNTVDDRQLGPDTDEWPGEQMRRLNDQYRSWRQDRYREFSDESPRNRHERGQTRPRGDDAPSLRRRERDLAR